MTQQNTVLTAEFTMDFYDAVFALWRTCEGIGLNEADSRESIERYLQRNPGMSRVALAGDGVAGDEVIGTILVGHDGRRGLIHHLAVHPAYRRRGIGRLLLSEGLEALRKTGVDKCHGYVFRNNADGMGFWRSAGWAVREDLHVISKDIDPD